MFLTASRYKSATGTFTVPPGGDGIYYYSVYLLVQDDEYSSFDIELNGDFLCTAYNDQQDTVFEEGPATCSATITQA